MDRMLQNYFNGNTWLLLGLGSLGVVVIVVLCLKEHFAKGPEPPASAPEDQKEKPQLPKMLEAWLVQALAGVQGYEARDLLRQELTNHIQETLEQFFAQGLDEAQAVARTLENLGSAA